MRIGMVAPPWLPVPPPAYGGTEQVVDRLARGFASAGHEVVLFTTGDSTCPVPRRWVLEQAESARMGQVVVEVHHLIHAYRELQGCCDVVHDHTVVGPVLAAASTDLRVVTTNHGPFDWALRDIYRSIADRVPLIAISQHQASTAPEVPVARVIHHGIDAAEFPVGDGDGGYFFFLGRMAPDKGARRAVQIARQAGARLLLAAKMREPLERAYYDEQVRPLLGEGIEYIGEVGGKEKLRLLAGARALINPIRWPEPFGLVMIEAMACGTPVLSFSEGAATEIVEHGVTGFLCRDEDDMAAHLDRVGELDRAACRTAVEGHFSAERMVADHLELFDQLLEAGPLSEPAPRP